MTVIRTCLVAFAVALAALVLGRVACGEAVAPVEPERLVPAEEWTPETRLWLARSLVGEAGWRAADEHAAIAHVYVVRWRMSKRRSLVQLVRAYSAAVHGRRNLKHPWIYGLNVDGAEPAGWPVGKARWTRYRDAWLDVLEWSDRWAAGAVANPCPRANHFGGHVDRHRADALRWHVVKCSAPMRNFFYDSTRKRPAFKLRVPGYRIPRRSKDGR